MLAGARQTGKSSLLKKLLPDAHYISLDRPVIAAEAEQNPLEFLAQFKKPVIIDEVQYAPSLFRALKPLMGEQRQTYGRWILTGSKRWNRACNENFASRLFFAKSYCLPY